MTIQQFKEKTENILTAHGVKLYFFRTVNGKLSNQIVLDINEQLKASDLIPKLVYYDIKRKFSNMPI